MPIQRPIQWVFGFYPPTPTDMHRDNFTCLCITYAYIRIYVHFMKFVFKTVKKMLLKFEFSISLYALREVSISFSLLRNEYNRTRIHKLDSLNEV